MNLKAMLLSTSLILSSAASMATPGDIGCRASLQGKEIHLLLGYDHHGQTVPSLIEVSKDNEVIFSSTSVEEKMVNVGTKRSPFINTVWSASDEESTVTVRLPEQDPSEELSVVLSIDTDSGLVKISELPMTCER